MFARLAISRAVIPVVVGSTMLSTARCSGEDHIPSIDYQWSHAGPLSSYDYASVRRGLQVYRQVCASCHSLDKVAFRSLVGVTHTEAHAKKLAQSYEMTDGPNDIGEDYERPGKLSDHFPAPYKNEEQGRSANNGAYPPDLSLMVKARHDGIDYIVGLLTGYVEAPIGKVMLPGLHYNPYFPGGAIAMPSPLADGQVDYEDGTPATVSQMAKDVAVFLAWVSEPEHDERKKSGVQFMFALTCALLLTGYYKRFRWSVLKTRKITYSDKYAPKK
jgi:ubiquinol-cytochrome c reductase cytochrome c1 subunit